MRKTIHLVGFGSQASAWAQCLRVCGWQVRVYLRDLGGKSAKHALTLKFEPEDLSALSKNLRLEPSAMIAMLCPDAQIGPVYRDHIATSAEHAKVTLILAHGYAVYANELHISNPKHSACLLAPKAIGPKLLENFQKNNPSPHTLVAGFHAPADRSTEVTELARALGFDANNLAPASFDQEAIGDLISEQGLLCGGVFTLLEWTLEAMKKAGVPESLMREECLTELELIAGLLREKGPEATFSAISQAAQIGTVAMKRRFENSNLKQAFQAQVDDVISKRFTKALWDPELAIEVTRLKQSLLNWQNQLTKRNSSV